MTQPRALARVLVCGWVLWSYFPNIDRYFPDGEFSTLDKCMEQLRPLSLARASLSVLCAPKAVNPRVLDTQGPKR